MKHTKCIVEGCDKLGTIKPNGSVVFTKGYCNMHYQRLLKHGNISFDPRSQRPKKCKVDGCMGGGYLNKNGSEYFIQGYCSAHYQNLICHGDTSLRHHTNKDATKHPLYKTHQLMLRRCFNSNCNHYKDYGGRGITVCERWRGIHGFTMFVDDMGEKPTPKHSIDRIDVNGNYEPLNCRWATPHQQAANKRNAGECIGVRFKQCVGKWQALITIDRKKIWLGYFKNNEDAVKARKEAEIKYGIVL